MDYSFEKMLPEHQGDVMGIFNYYTENTFAAYPEGKVSDMIFFKFLEIGQTYPSFVIKAADGVVVGFCMLRPYNPFSAFRETAELTYFIKNGYTGKGLGKSALNILEIEAKKLGIKHLLADISSENTDSIEFHLRNGFNHCGLFSNTGKKFGKNFSVVWMEKEII